VIGNISNIAFNDTTILSYLRNQGPVDRELCVDMSVGMQYRPFTSQNVVLNMSLATLLPGTGYRQLYGSNDRPYSALANLLLTF